MILLLPVYSFPAPAQGLRFLGLERKIEERTSMEIRGVRNMKCRDSLCIDFEFRCYEDSPLGYIFQLITTRKQEPVINLFYDGLNGNGELRVIWEGRRFIAITQLPPQGERDHWISFHMKLDPREDSVYIKVSDMATVSGAIELPNKIYPNIGFGKRDYILEVPSVAIKNLSIQADSRAITFPLDEDSGTLALSNRPFAHAKVKNPHWLATDNLRWKKEFSVSSSSFMCAGYDTLQHRIYSISRDSIYEKSLASGSLTARALAEKCPVKSFLGTSFVNPNDSLVYIYEAYMQGDAPAPTMASLDPVTLTWSVQSYDRQDMELHHHAEFFDKFNEKLLIFGGFGQRKYSGVFRACDLESGKWMEVPLRGGDGKLWPRFFQSMGYNERDGQLYIFGGMGNEIGDQIVGHDYFYDLNIVDPGSMESRQVWDIRWKGRNKVPGRNMILPGDGWFYVLFYPESFTDSEVSLYRFRMVDGRFEELADKFPIFSDRISSNTNLFFDERLQTLIAIVEESPDDIRSTVTAYTLAYPPKPLTAPTVVKRRRRLMIEWSLLAATAAIAVVFIVRRKRNRSGVDDDVEPEESERRVNALYLFGPLNAYDRDGRDVSMRFSEKLRLMFCLLLQAGEGGISSKEINFLLWPEKEEREAKNIRGVTISKLRKALSDIDGVTIEYAGGRFRFTCGDDFFCDYIAVKKILESERPDRNALVNLASRGKFLSYETDPVLDGMKEEMESRIEPAVIDEMTLRFKKKQYKGVIKCADIIFGIDPLNDAALAYMILAMRKLDMDSEARIKYREFVTRYRKDYDENYPRKYEDLRL